MQSAVGVVVTVVLAVFGYRQTWGASRERARSATDELVVALGRLLVDDRFMPSDAELQAMLEAQCRTHRVSPDLMPTPAQLMSSVLVRLARSEFLPQASRADLIDQVSRSIRESTAQAVSVRPSKSDREWPRLLALLIGSSSLLGLAFSLLASEPSGAEPISLTTTAISLVASVAAASIVLAILRSRNGGTSGEAASTSSKYERQLDHAWRDTFDLKGIRSKIGGAADPYDYIVWLKSSGKTLLDLKGRASKAERMDALCDAMRDEDSPKAFVLCDTTLDFDVPDNVEVLPFKRLLNRLSADEPEVGS